MGNYIEFEDIIKLEIIYKFCKLFGKITGLILDINDKSGIHPKKFYPEAMYNKFCNIIISTSIGRSNCIKCGRELGIIAAKKGKPIITNCHMGLTELVYPIIINNKFIGTLESGQILTNQPSNKHFNEIINRLKDIDIDLSKLKKEYFKTKVIEKNLLKSYIDLMGLVVNYIIETEDTIISLKLRKNKSIIYQAKEYIERNYNRKILISDISSFVNISASYFEHLFIKEVGMTFIEYLNHYRIEKAKKLLLNKPISFVCHEVGFGSLSHFYKFFRRYLGCTPNLFKKEIQDKFHSDS